MKKSIFLLTGLSLLFACQQPTAPAEGEDSADTVSTAQEEQTKEASLRKVWETDTVLTTNESVLYHQDENLLYVSNIAGQPTEKDGVGFISKLSTDGSIQELKWVTGLDAPKGMGIRDGKLYVTNIDELVEIDLETGEIENRYSVEGASFLNDVTIADDAVYFSGMASGKLHKLQDGEVSLVKEGLKSINGVAYHNGQVYMLTGMGLQRLDDDGNVETINSEVTGGDGLIIIDEDTYLASRWKGEIWLIEDGVATKLLDSKDEEIQTADIGYIPGENLVLVPRFFSNKVSAYRLEYNP